MKENKLESEGCKYLGALSNLTQLEQLSLNLKSNPIGDQGCEELS